MTKRELAEILKYSSPKELFVVTWKNVLKLYKCPFKVRVIHNIGKLNQEEIVWVEEVKTTKELLTVYIISGDAYYYYHFEILDK